MTKKKKRDREKGGILASVRLTIPLLILLAALSVIGTIVPQNASEREYLRLYGEGTYSLFKSLGLLDMYHSWWFVGVLSILAVNLIACSARRIPGVWQHIRRTGSGYARLGTYLTHLGVLTLLAGGLIGAAWGFKGYVEIAEGDAAEDILIGNSGREMRPLGFAVRCDSFRVAFYPGGSPKEYVSTLTFLEGGKAVIERAPLRVNHPLSYRGLTFYQSTYGVKSRVQIGVKKSGGTRQPSVIVLGPGEVKPIPGTNGAQIGFMKHGEGVHGPGGDAVLAVLFNPGAAPEGFWLFTRDTASGGEAGGFSFTLKKIEKRYYTGLQVTRDPGVPVVWVGCSLLVIGMVATFTLRRPARKESSGGVRWR